MKKLFMLTLALVLSLSLAACGGNSDTPAGSNPSNNSTAAPESNPANSPAGATGSSESSGTASGGSSKPAPSNNSDGGGAAASYLSMFESGNYHMKAKMLGGDGSESTMESYNKDGMTATIMEMGGQSSWMIYRDEKIYIIMESEKSYMEMPTQYSQTEGMVETEGLVYIGSGTDVFDGKTLPYEEYKDIDGNRAQYFMDGNDLAGIRNTGDDYEIDIVILVLDQNVPDDVFEIPSDYEKIGS